MAGVDRARMTIWGERLTRDWLRVVVALWLAACVWFLWQRWGVIHWFALPDTDDNIRMTQVRDWLHGQGWYDLRQYRLDPPRGFDIHWSRLVDLPIAGIVLLVRPVFGGIVAEKTAAALAPMLPMLVAMVAMALAARRLVAPGAYALGAALVLGCVNVVAMFMPLRIDHHGWQLAMLAVGIAGLADERGARGGITVALATVLSLVIGLELMPFLALLGGAIVLRWVWDEAEAPRLSAYALALTGATAIGYVLFTSEANRAPRCDALTPVWLSAILVAGALLFALSHLRGAERGGRLAAAVGAGGLLAVAFALVWPGCLGRPEHVSPELDRLWLSNVKEARPITMQKPGVILQMAFMPTIGLVGTLFALWRARRDPQRLAAWLAVFALAALSCAMLFWQTRIATAAQLIGTVGVTALAWELLRWIAALGAPVAARVAGGAAALGLLSGLGAYYAAKLIPTNPPTARSRAITQATRRCPTLPALAPIARLPATTVMTFVDLGPRLIAVTHHSAIAGPYHRNGAAILDIHHAFDGPPDQARAIAHRHGATLLLTCPNMAESTIYRARSPHGFYAQLASGKRFPWLEPVPLPGHSPYRLWRIR